MSNRKAVSDISKNTNTRKRERKQLENDSIKAVQNKERNIQSTLQHNPQHKTLGNSVFDKQPKVVLKRLTTDELIKFGVKLVWKIYYDICEFYS